MCIDLEDMRIANGQKEQENECIGNPRGVGMQCWKPAHTCHLSTRGGWVGHSPAWSTGWDAKWQLNSEVEAGDWVWGQLGEEWEQGQRGICRANQRTWVFSYSIQVGWRISVTQHWATETDRFLELGANPVKPIRGCLKKQGGEQLRRLPNVNLWLPHASPHMSNHMHMYTDTWTHTDTHNTYIHTDAWCIKRKKRQIAIN